MSKVIILFLTIFCVFAAKADYMMWNIGCGGTRYICAATSDALVVDFCENEFNQIVDSLGDVAWCDGIPIWNTIREEYGMTVSDMGMFNPPCPIDDSPAQMEYMVFLFGLTMTGVGVLLGVSANQPCAILKKR